METQCELGGRGVGGLVPLLTCHCGPSRSILVLINEAVGSDSLGKSRAVFSFTGAAHVYLPTTDGPPGALGARRVHLRVASFVLISEHVPQRRHPTYR